MAQTRAIGVFVGEIMLVIFSFLEADASIAYCCEESEVSGGLIPVSIFGMSGIVDEGRPAKRNSGLLILSGTGINRNVRSVFNPMERELKPLQLLFFPPM